MNWDGFCTPLTPVPYLPSGHHHARTSQSEGSRPTVRLPGNRAGLSECGPCEDGVESEPDEQ